jgi:hypothetical protein
MRANDVVASGSRSLISVEAMVGGDDPIGVDGGACIPVTPTSLIIAVVAVVVVVVVDVDDVGGVTSVNAF